MNRLILLPILRIFSYSPLQKARVFLTFYKTAIFRGTNHLLLKYKTNFLFFANLPLKFASQARKYAQAH